MVRQYGNFSFSRIFQAGHEVPAYQPEISYQVFQRAMFGMDIATGDTATASATSDNGTMYSTTGEQSTFDVKNDVPPMPQPSCYVLSLASTCTQEQADAVLSGNGTVANFFLMDNNTQNLFDGLSEADPVTGAAEGEAGGDQDVGDGRLTSMSTDGTLGSLGITHAPGAAAALGALVAFCAVLLL